MVPLLALGLMRCIPIARLRRREWRRLIDAMEAHGAEELLVPLSCAGICSIARLRQEGTIQHLAQSIRAVEPSLRQLEIEVSFSRRHVDALLDLGLRDAMETVSSAGAAGRVRQPTARVSGPAPSESPPELGDPCDHGRWDADHTAFMGGESVGALALERLAATVVDLSALKSSLQKTQAAQALRYETLPAGALSPREQALLSPRASRDVRRDVAVVNAGGQAEECHAAASAHASPRLTGPGTAACAVVVVPPPTEAEPSPPPCCISAPLPSSPLSVPERISPSAGLPTCCNHRSSLNRSSEATKRLEQIRARRSQLSQQQRDESADQPSPRTLKALGMGYVRSPPPSPPDHQRFGASFAASTQDLNAPAAAPTAPALSASALIARSHLDLSPQITNASTASQRQRVSSSQGRRIASAVMDALFGARDMPMDSLRDFRRASAVPCGPPSHLVHQRSRLRTVLTALLEHPEQVEQVRRAGSVRRGQGGGGAEWGQPAGVRRGPGHSFVRHACRVLRRHS